MSWSIWSGQPESSWTVLGSHEQRKAIIYWTFAAIAVPTAGAVIWWITENCLNRLAPYQVRGHYYTMCLPKEQRFGERIRSFFVRIMDALTQTAPQRINSAVPLPPRNCDKLLITHIRQTRKETARYNFYCLHCLPCPSYTDQEQLLCCFQSPYFSNVPWHKFQHAFICEGICEEFHVSQAEHPSGYIWTAVST